MSGERADDRKATDEAVARDLARLDEIEGAKREQAPGSTAHIELADAARHLGRRIRAETEAEADIAREQADERRDRAPD